MANGVPLHLLDSYCFGLNSFLMFGNQNRTESTEKTFYTNYYQWICFILLLQSVLFYIPHYLWQLWEGNRLQSLQVGLSSMHSLNETERTYRRDILLDYFRRNLRRHNIYALQFFACECLNFLNVLGQTSILNYIFDGYFFNFSVFSTFKLSAAQRVDPMAHIFPKLISCEYSDVFRFADSEIEDRPSVCILPLNNFNEMVYTIIWFWFMILTILSACGLIYRLIVVLVPKFRVNLLQRSNHLLSTRDVKSILRQSRFGDWFLLHQLARNIDSLTHKELVAELATKFDDSD